MEAIQLILGALLAIVTTIIVENVRKPKLSITISSPVDVSYPNHPASDARFLGVILHNAPMPPMFRWMMRGPALQCYGTVNFYHTDGQNVFGRAMTIRWSGSPEPLANQFQINNMRVSFFDGHRLTQLGRMDIFPGTGEKIDIASRFDADSECFGWSNENYYSDPKWRNPDWVLPRGRYLVKVTVFSSGETLTKLFRLENDVPRNAFRLENALPSDRVID